jgi:hypothetical protein
MALKRNRCTGLGACAAQLGGSYLTWSDPTYWGVTTVGAFRLSDRRKRTIGNVPRASAVLHTRRVVYVNTVEGKVYAAPLRGRKPYR